ncbi:hypothetical protein FOZ61_003066 [Perkinsus olseni]|uniref:Uncharacterized protein n=1 Tax=Perkinsus olseni TaxID=32597 RepID=A0A7J6LQM6_PEROL|nr:hypothetical protein FOZ61_003066 [Perkinsus olseni]
MSICLSAILLSSAAATTPEVVDILGISFPIPKIGDYECQKVQLNGSYEYKTISRPEGDRHFFVYTPAVTQVRALVLNLHHLSGDCRLFRKQSCIVNAADKNGWLVVTPCGLPGLLGLNSWNAGSCCQTDKTIDDYGFMKDIIALLLPTNHIPVYAVGYSNGAMLAEGLLCRNIVTRAVSVSGVITGGKEGLKACRSSFRMSAEARLGHVHGLLDPFVPYYFGPTSLIFDFPSVPNDMNTWAVKFNCDGTTKTSRGLIFDFTEWRNCQNGSEVKLVRNNIGSHFWWEVDDFSTSSFAINMLEN